MAAGLASVRSVGGGVASAAFGGLKDSLLEIKDSVVSRQEAPPELVDAPTPEDRWFTPVTGWPTEVADLPPSIVPPGYKVPKWKPPSALIPNAREAPHLFEDLMDTTTKPRREQVLGAEDMGDAAAGGEQGEEGACMLTTGATSWPAYM